MLFVGLFFCIDGKMLVHTSPFRGSLRYGDYLTYPESHDQVWERNYRQDYHVDYDYYPRGRLVYNTRKKHYTLYYDKCAEEEAFRYAGTLNGALVKLKRDEHYQCHMCNADYCYIDRED